MLLHQITDDIFRSTRKKQWLSNYRISTTRKKSGISCGTKRTMSGFWLSQGIVTKLGATNGIGDNMVCVQQASDRRNVINQKKVMQKVRNTSNIQVPEKKCHNI